MIIERTGPESDTRPIDQDYDCQVRELCDEFGALLVFDEIVIGFRSCMGGIGGAQKRTSASATLSVNPLPCIAGYYAG